MDKEKHEIKHDKTSTRVTDVNVIPLHSATQVQSLLFLAESRRKAATTLVKYVAISNPLRTLLTVFPLFLPANDLPAHIRSLLFVYQERTLRAGTPAKIRSTSSISLVRSDLRRAEPGMPRIGRKRRRTSRACMALEMSLLRWVKKEVGGVTSISRT